MLKNNYFVLTGAMGAGKSTVINKLQDLKYNCIPEPARIILKEQRSSGGEGVPEKDSGLFTRLMLTHMLTDHAANKDSDELFVFDRGLPDLIAYSVLFNIDKDAYLNAAMDNRYNKHVFMFEPWEEIYTTDDERKMSFAQSKRFGESVKKIYVELGYSVIGVPFLPAEERAAFIIDSIERIFRNEC
ncbi:MAG: AAA family ATPase [Ignavibacteria bacterium]